MICGVELVGQVGEDVEPGGVLVVREQERAVGQGGGVAAQLDQLVPHALDRRDELHVGGDLGRLHRVVHEVHPVGGGVRRSARPSG